MSHMSTNGMPTVVYGSELPGPPKKSGFFQGGNITIDEKPTSIVKPEEKTNIVTLIATTFIPLVVSIFLLIHFFRPSDPQFTLTDATVHAFNFSMQHSLLSSQMQVTISSRNPNERFGISYEDLGVHADYKSQQVTFSTSLPATFLGPKDADVWSPYLSGFDVPVAPYFGVELEKDENGGFLFLSLMVEGKVKYKLWFLGYSGRLSVTCPAYFTFGRDGSSGTGGVIRFQQTSKCIVDA